MKDPVFWNISALKKSCMPVILSSVVQVNTLNSQKFTLAISTININDKCSWHLPQSYGRSRPIWQLRMWSARDQSRSTWCWKEAFCLIIHPFLILCLIDTRVQGWTLTVSLTVKYLFFDAFPNENGEQSISSSIIAEWNLLEIITIKQLYIQVRYFDEFYFFWAGNNLTVLTLTTRRMAMQAFHHTAA